MFNNYYLIILNNLYFNHNKISLSTTFLQPQNPSMTVFLHYIHAVNNSNPKNSLPFCFFFVLLHHELKHFK